MVFSVKSVKYDECVHKEYDEYDDPDYGTYESIMIKYFDGDGLPITNCQVEDELSLIVEINWINNTPIYNSTFDVTVDATFDIRTYVETSTYEGVGNIDFDDFSLRMIEEGTTVFYRNSSYS